MVGTILDISELKRMQEREIEHFMLKKALEDVSNNEKFDFVIVFCTAVLVVLNQAVFAYCETNMSTEYSSCVVSAQT
jgi:hypothetical protein